MNFRHLTRKDFKLEMLLGLGRFSQVYLAKAPDDTPVAMKIPRKEVRSDPKLAERFAQEVGLSLALSHKYLVRGLAGKPFGEEAFLALEYMSEGSLEDRLSHGALPADEAKTCLQQIAAALVFLHDQGVIHQDVKPSNIYRNQGVYKLGDLGVARTRENYRLGERAGSPFYMAPELFAGGDPNPASDTYSFGVLAYELLTGRRPFKRETYEQLEYAHLHLPAAPTNLPQPLDRALRGLLDKDPERRKTLKDFLIVLANPAAPPQPKDKKPEAPLKGKGIFGLFRKKG